MPTNKRALEDEIARLTSQFTQVVATADAEEQKTGHFSLESQSALDRISDAIDRIEMRLLAEQSAASLKAKQPEGVVNINGVDYSYERGTAEHYRFMRVLRDGMHERDFDRVKLATLTDEQKAMSQADDTVGGFLSSDEFANDILRAMSDASPVRSVVRVVPTGGTGALVPVRSSVQTAKRVSETAQRVTTAGDLTFKLDTVPTHEAYADTAISRHLLADSTYPLDAELVDAASKAFALLEGIEFVKGTGNGEMLGLDSATLPSGNVVTCADSAGHLVAADDVMKFLNEGLKAVYMPGARLLLNPKMLSTLRRLKATSGNTYLFPQIDMPGYFAGVPYTLIPDMDDNATPAAGKNVMYLLHPSAYALVVRQDITVQRLTEMYAEVGKVAFYVWQRSGGQLVLPEAAARLVTA